MWDIPHKDATKGKPRKGNSHRAINRPSIKKEKGKDPNMRRIRHAVQIEQAIHAINSALEEKMFQRVIRKRNRIKGGLHHLTYIVKARCKMKKLDISLGDARKEASQSRNPPKPNKSTRTAIIQGVQTAIFRIPDPDMKILFGTEALPILHPRDELAEKLMKQSHTVKSHDYHPIHRTIHSARTALSSGMYGAWIPGSTAYLQMLGFTCSTCNSYRDWSYSADLGPKYTRIKNQIRPFKEVSIDPLGPVLVKAFPGSRRHVICYPLIAKYLNSAAVQIILMECI